jgi:DNA-binding transcriptional regulator GbsR (MarR family)
MAAMNERSAFIEESGLLFESIGMTRISGRIIGYLMISDKDMVSFEELTQVLQASKSSVSTNIKSTVSVGFIKPMTLPGDRKTYYMLAQDISWKNLFVNRIKLLEIFNELLLKGLNLRTNPKDKSSQWLSKARGFYTRLINEIPLLIEKWETEELKEASDKKI